MRTWVGADGVPETRISVRPKRLARVQFVSQLYQHLPALGTVVTAGVAAIRTEREGAALALAAIELLVGAWVLLTILQEARHLFGREAAYGAHGHPPTRGHQRPHETGGPERVDVPGLAAAALGYVEVWHHAHEVGRFKLVSPLMLSATVALFFALGGRRWIRHRLRRRGPHLAVTPSGISYRGGRRRRWAAAWDDVAGIDYGHDHVTVRLRDGGTHVLRGADHFGGEALIEDARAAVGRYAPPHLAETLGSAERVRRS